VTRRLLIAFVGLIAVVLVVLEVPLGITYRERQLDDLRARVQGDAVAIASHAEDVLETKGPVTDSLLSISEGYSDRTGGRVVIVDPTGQAIVDTAAAEGEELRDFSSRPEIEVALSGRATSGTRRSETLGQNLLYVAVPVASGGEVHGAARVTLATSTVDDRVRRNWYALGLMGVVTLATATAAAFALSRWVVRPLAHLEVATTALGQGALDTRIDTDEGPPEVRRLGAAVNETAARLEELVGAQEAFVADASHQLRTPLTALRLRLELLEGSLAAVPEARDQLPDLAAALAEVARLSRLVDGLLELARAERTGASATAGAVDLRTVLAERAEAWGPVADEEGVTIEVTGESTSARATPDRLAQVVDNLLANAIEASPDGAAVTLQATTGPAGPELHVADRGPGLSDEERERAFHRFWSHRAAGRLGGSGLGLAIVRKLVEADGGTVELRARSGGGLDAVVALPPAPPPEAG
jgi:signal transduction histidine kinase